MARFWKTLLITAVSAFLLILGLIFFRPDLTVPKEAVKQELRTPASRFLDWEGAEIHYTDEGEGIPVLMIHGFGGAHTHFSKLAELMKDRYRIIRVDLPGFGLSDLPALSPGEDYVQKYRDYFSFLLRSLQLDSLYVIGNSMGGLVTWVAAADHPEKVKKIVLLSPAGYELEKVLAAREPFRYNFLRNAAARGIPLFMSRHELCNAYFHKDKVDESYVLLINKFVNIKGNIPNMFNVILSDNFPDTALIQKVRCPALIIWGKEDQVIPADHAARFHRDIRNSKIVIFEHCGHCPMLEDPERTQAECIRFFETKL